MKYTFEDLCKMIEEEDIVLDVDFKTLDHSKILKEQGVDSLDLASILFGIENHFKIHISKEAVAKDWNTIEKMLYQINTLNK